MTPPAPRATRWRSRTARTSRVAPDQAGDRAGRHRQALEQVEGHPGGGRHRRLDRIGVGHRHEGLAPVTLGEAVEGARPCAPASRRTTRRRGTGTSSGTTGPLRHSRRLRRAVSLAPVHAPKSHSSRPALDAHPQPQAAGDRLGGLHGPLERRRVDRHRWLLERRRCARPPLSACALPSSERWRPGARPGSTDPVVGVRPCRTRSATAGAGFRRAGTARHRTLSAVDVSPLDELTSEITRCRRCPRLVAWREEVAAERRAAFADQDYWGRPVPGFGDPGPGWRWWGWHRRPTAGTGPGGSSPATGRGTGCSRRCGGRGWRTSPRASSARRRARAVGGVRAGGGALRPAAEQAHPGRARRSAGPFSAGSSACSVSCGSWSPSASSPTR